MRVRFRDVLRPETILIGLRSATCEEVLDRMEALLRTDDRVRSAGSFMKAVRDHEREGGTLLEEGLWIPHARSEEVGSLLMGVALPAEPIGPIRAAFLIGIPPNLAHDYLRLIGCLARAWKQEEVRSHLTSAPNAHTLLHALDCLES